ncbi:MAG: site-specific DNA-methyltransferase [Gammaproteobacteria bacterium]
MPSLNWIGKDAVTRHHRDVPFRLLEPVPSLSLPAAPHASPGQRPHPSPPGRGAGGEGDYGGNLIVQGDNLLALKALLPRYAGQVKCIYIDPPYNTGNEGWVYNDNVNSPEIRRWLGEVVGKEGETLDRHDRWLCMMYPRLMLLKQFLREDGAIFVSIDDNEVATLRLLMDEIFGASLFVGDIVWQHSVQAKGYSGTLSIHHNHTLVYGRAAFRLGDLARTEEHNINYSNPDRDPRGPWRSGDVRNALVRPNLMYDITAPNGCVIHHPEKGWRFSRETFDRELADGKIIFSKDQKRIIRKIYLADQAGRVPESIWFATEAGTTREATAEVADLLGEKGGFDTPKPTRLVQRILQIASDKDSIILDSFAGSGTTAHAVLKQNAEDGGNRRFILVEMDEDIARNVTAERVRRVAQGYRKGGKSALSPAPLPAGEGKDRVPGLGGSFQFCKLGKPLFDARGHISNDVRFAELARFVWFVETGMGLPAARASKKSADIASPLLGVHAGRAVYLLYNGILKDRSIDGGNVLTTPLLQHLPPHEGPKVVYAARSAITAERLRKLGIVFKQLPYQLRVAP